MNTLTRIGAAAFGLALTATTAFAEDCTTLTVEDRFDLEGEDIVALYDCLSDKLAAGYAKEGDAVGANFRSWSNSHAPSDSRITRDTHPKHLRQRYRGGAISKI